MDDCIGYAVERSVEVRKRQAETDAPEATANAFATSRVKLLQTQMLLALKEKPVDYYKGGALWKQGGNVPSLTTAAQQ